MDKPRQGEMMFPPLHRQYINKNKHSDKGHILKKNQRGAGRFNGARGKKQLSSDRATRGGFSEEVAFRDLSEGVS